MKKITQTDIDQITNKLRVILESYCEDRDEKMLEKGYQVFGVMPDSIEADSEWYVVGQLPNGKFKRTWFNESKDHAVKRATNLNAMLKLQATQ